MITAIDSSVILDVLTADEKFLQFSKEALKAAEQNGQLIICDLVAAEIYPSLPCSLEIFLNEWHLKLVPGSLKQAELAGESFKKYCARNKRARKIISDFVIAAHAECNANQLLTRDRGYARDYFRKLKIISPLKKIKG